MRSQKKNCQFASPYLSIRTGQLQDQWTNFHDTFTKPAEVRTLCRTVSYRKLNRSSSVLSAAYLRYLRNHPAHCIFIYKISWEEVHKPKEMISERILHKRKYYSKRMSCMPRLRNYHHHLLTVVTYNGIMKSLRCVVKALQ